MKINPVAIQTYQQANRQNRADLLPASADSKPAAETTVTIPLQDEAMTSPLAVKPNAGSYAEYLSSEEREALELLFSRFRNNGRFGASARANGNTDAVNSVAGRRIDVKA